MEFYGPYYLETGDGPGDGSPPYICNFCFFAVEL